ncbi:MAG: hypothetical protein DCF17_18040 [Shackletoniella antarctica]|uniref:Alpha/beta hydrolase n=1 Tax=Shackletoniella antarctica TaxID=268115 RepID=A0A2W4VX87_9CYAN|nr:MAG: hypothetical protein DCF17_18040 [Shackletoniella antarctica]
MHMLLLLGAFCAMVRATVTVFSPGAPRPIVDQNGAVVPGSLSEKTFIEVNGAEQGVFIKSRSTELPVLLYLHGGIPDYFLTARHPTGLTCSYRLARSYAAELRAPVKGFYSFSNSAHSPIFEEPARIQDILRQDVLQGTTTLADAL